MHLVTMSIVSACAFLLLLLPLHLLVVSAAADDDQWCPTSVTPLPTLPSNYSSYTFHGAADDECSDFFFSAILTSPNSSTPSTSTLSPSILLRASPSLNISHINPFPIPPTLLASGLRYIGGMAYSNLHLFAPLTSTPPPSLLPVSRSPPSRRRLTPPSPTPQSALLVLSTSTLKVVFSYPIASPIRLDWVAVDYATSPSPTLYSSSSSTSIVLAFAIATTGELTPLPSLTLPATLPPVTGATLLNPGTLLLLSSVPLPSPFLFSAYLTSLTSLDLSSLTATPVANMTTRHPATSTADVWSTDLPGFGSIHFITRSALYNLDLCS